MRIYLLWFKDNNACAVMDVTKVVEDTYEIAPELPRALIASSLCDMMEADEILNAESEEQMMNMFINVKKVTRAPKKEELH